jgi:L-lactate dehydrogenase complex protein LldF
LHIAVVGLEKIIPTAADLAAFLRLLARSATGQAITAYTSHFRGPGRVANGAPRALHIVVVDNGRSQLLGRPAFRDALACIRCGACLNTCPVYRRSGGHSYGATIPGPIGSVLEPARDPVRHQELPHACSLCGSCSDVCPVRIPLHHQLLAWRSELVANSHPTARRMLFRLAQALFSNPWVYHRLGQLGRRLARRLPVSWLEGLTLSWSRQRALPELPERSFREIYDERAAR